MRRVVALSCDWCEQNGDFETPEDAIEDGWLRLETSEDEYDFCSFECMFSRL